MGGNKGAAPPPQIAKAHWKHLLSHARCWVECDTQGVYYARHTPWKHVEGRLRHNNAQYFHWMLSSCWFKISSYKVGVLYILAWFRGGLGFEYHLDDNANLLDR